MQVIRCSSCNKVLMEAEINDGVVKKKCKCGHLNIIEVRPAPPAAGQAYQDRVAGAMAKKDGPY